MNPTDISSMQRAMTARSRKAADYVREEDVDMLADDIDGLGDSVDKLKRDLSDLKAAARKLNGLDEGELPKEDDVADFNDACLAMKKAIERIEKRTGKEEGMSMRLAELCTTVAFLRRRLRQTADETVTGSRRKASSDSIEDIAEDVSSRMSSGMDVVEAFKAVGESDLYRKTREHAMPSGWENLPHEQRVKALLKGLKKVASFKTAARTWEASRELKTKNNQFPAGTKFNFIEFAKDNPRYVRFVTDDGRKLLMLADKAHNGLKGWAKPPSFKVMEKWSDDGVAKSVFGNRVEPDGWDHEGSPSWLLVLGMI